MYKTKNTAMQINETSNEPSLLQLLVKLDQSRKVYQLSMINQRLWMTLL